MSGGRQVLRVRPDDPVATIRGLVAERLPAVVEGFAERWRLREVDTAARAAERLGHLPLVLHDKERGTARTRLGETRRPSDLAERLERWALDPDDRERCSEQEVPASLDGWYDLPEGLGDPADRTMQLFVGPAGAHAQMHFDGDYRDNVLVQVFGTKRVTLVAPPHGPKLLPLRQLGGVFLDRLPAGRRDAWARFAGATVVTLGPGDALFVPALMWHHVEYLETSMSLSVRIGRSRLRRWLQRRFHRDLWTQNVAWWFPTDTVDDRTRSVVDVLQAVDAARYAEPIDKWRAADAAFQGLVRRWDGLAVDPDWAIVSTRPYAERLALEDVRHGLYALAPDGGPAHPEPFEEVPCACA